MVWSLEGFRHPRFTGKSWGWWLEDLGGMRPKSAQNYVRLAGGFLEWADMTTESLFEFHRENSRAEDVRDKRLLGVKVYDYQKYLLENGKSTGTCGLVVKALRSFFKANEMDFKMNGSKVKVISTQIPNIQKDEMQQILEVCGSIRLKAAIYFLKDTGMRISDAVLIKAADIKGALEGELEYFTWSMRQQKTQRMADPVLGPEAIKWLKRWEAEKSRLGIVSEWLFVTVENYKSVRRVGDGMDSTTLSQLFRHYRDKAGIESGVSIHSLRKFHKTALEFAGVPTSWVDRMQGRVGQGSGQVYTKPNPTQLIDMFKRGYSELRIEGGSNEDTREYLDHLDAENEAFASRIKELEEQVKTLLKK